MRALTIIILLVILGIPFNQSYAQIIGIEGGFNLATMLSKDNNNTYSDSFGFNPGFHIGASVELPIKGFLAFESGLIFTTKGYTNENEALYEKQTLDVKIYYVDLPIVLKANGNLGNNVILSGSTGPYLGYGLIGKTKAEGTYMDEKYSINNDIDWGKDINRFDFGWTFGGELTLNSILLGASFDLGLANIFPDNDNGNTLKNRVIKFSVGYKFN